MSRKRIEPKNRIVRREKRLREEMNQRSANYEQQKSALTLQLQELQTKLTEAETHK